MIVVADTSPLNYLLQIDEIELLPAIFGHVLLPEAVFRELQHPKTSAKVRQWVTHLPAWLEVRAVATVANPDLMTLDVGERGPFSWRWSLALAQCSSMKQADASRRQSSTWKCVEPLAFWSTQQD